MLFATCVLLLLGAARAHAVTLNEVPPLLRSRLPEILWRIIDPRALAALSLADLTEFADAYESGALKFVSATRVLEHSGPLSPELARLVLQVPEGAPFVDARFVRLAKQAYGRGVFSMLKWKVLDNDDGSVDIELRYASNESQVWSPLYAMSGLSGLVLGARYDDYRYQGADKQLRAWGQMSELDTAEPEGGVSYTDGTLSGGRNALSLTLGVTNQWRHRGYGTPAAADLRQRTAELDAAYAWRESAALGLHATRYGLGASFYSQEHYVFAGDPGAGGTAPRSDFSEAGHAGYLSLFYEKSRYDKAYNPAQGWDYSARLEQHAGAFDFSSLSAAATWYIPAPNPLGLRPQAPFHRGHENDVKLLFPTASVALEAQAVAADGDVPFSREVRGDATSVARGIEFDRYAGTKLLALRGEYRFDLDKQHLREAFVFTDHAWAGERFDALESVDTYGIGALLRLPIYGGVKLGGWYGWSLDGRESSFGIALGHMF